jgi:hypothetical protein
MLCWLIRLNLKTLCPVRSDPLSKSSSYIELRLLLRYHGWQLDEALTIFLIDHLMSEPKTIHTLPKIVLDSSDLTPQQKFMFSKCR